MIRLINPVFIPLCRRVSIVLFLLAGAAASFAQSTNIAIGTTVLQPAVKRLGINFSLQTFYDSGQLTKNLISRNPGFEGEIFQSTIRCASGSATTCVDDDPYSGWPAGFWNGATIESFFGHSLGRKDSVASYTAAQNGVGGTFTFAANGTTVSAGDYIIVRMKVPGDAGAGWWLTTGGAASIGTNSTDLPPGTTGTQTLSVKTPSAGDTATVASYFDSSAGKTFVALRGAFQLKFKAKGTGGSNTLAVSVGRFGLPLYIDQPALKLTGAWSDYTLTFNASESGAVPGTVAVKFATVGQDAFLLDDVSLTQSDSDPGNSSAFRDPVVNALKTLNPGMVRFWATQLGDSLDNLIAPQFARQRSGYSAFNNRQEDISYGLPEFLQLCETVGTEAWVVVPATFSTIEAANLIEFLAGSSATPYGAKRAALGHPAPFTSTLGKIHLEFGNEAWNGGFKGGVIEVAAAYGQRAQAIFGAMRGNSAFTPSAFDLVLGGQAVWPGRNQDIQNNCNNNDTFAVGPYIMNTIDAAATAEQLYGSTFAAPEALWSPGGASDGVTGGGYMYQNQKALAASSHPVPLSIYETNLGTTEGAISQATLNAYTPSLGAGLAAIDNMLQQMRQGVINQNLFALGQFQFLRADGKTVPLWGSVVDMGVTDRRRPQYLALQLANQAIGSNAMMLQTVHSGADPTWNQPLLNTVQLNGAHYLQSFAFASGSQKSVVVFNLQRASSLPVTFNGANAPNGTVTMRQLTSASPYDTNETVQAVNISTQSLANFNAATGVTLPPFSMTVLTWTGTAAPSGPVISAVAAGSVTGTSATITWNTDQASSSTVTLGTTPVLAAVASANAASISNPMVTAHSVPLTGLAPGTTYYYSVQSTNSQGLATTSATSTFVTAAAVGAPTVSSVSVTGVTGTSATINWTTDKASSTQVLYGATAVYGLLSALNANPVTAHSVTLSGLTAGTTYNFAAVSAAAGLTGTSVNATFTTTAAASAPFISAVNVSGITGSSATVNWTTDRASSTQVVYGPTAAYGSSTGVGATTVTTHSVTLTGLTAGTTYNFVVVSTAAAITATSANATFTTSAPPTAAPPAASAPAPVLSGVAFWGVSGSGVTISWATDKASDSAVEYGTTPALGQTSPIQFGLAASHGATLGGLAGNTTYYFRARSITAGGGVGYSTIYSFKTLDVGAPVISNVVATPTGANAATVSWAVSKAANTQVEYGPNTSYGRWSVSTSGTMTALGWVPSGVIHYRIHSMDAAGNASVTADFIFVEP